jgi:hypothetical protein
MRRVTVVGAGGFYGRMIAESLLAVCARGELVVASREPKRIPQSLGMGGSGNLRVTVRKVDVRSFESCVTALQDCDLCVDCVGPFQGRDVTLVKACAEADCDYLDLSDAPKYCGAVEGVTREAGIRVYTSHSTFSATTLLCVTELKKVTGNADEIRVGLVLATRGGTGPSTMKSLLKTLDGGGILDAPAGEMRFPPPIGKRLLMRYPTPDDLWMRRVAAAKEYICGIGFTNRAILPLLKMVRRSGLRFSALVPLIRAGQAAIKTLPGSAIGCLRVSAKGSKEEAAVGLVAVGGPEVPTFPAVLTARAYLTDGPPVGHTRMCWLHEWLAWDDWVRDSASKGVKVI